MRAVEDFYSLHGVLVARLIRTLIDFRPRLRSERDDFASLKLRQLRELRLSYAIRACPVAAVRS